MMVVRGNVREHFYGSEGNLMESISKQVRIVLIKYLRDNFIIWSA